jgi:antitoxin component YwqK of YwqJK toxin-antitoxin module
MWRTILVFALGLGSIMPSFAQPGDSIVTGEAKVFYYPNGNKSSEGAFVNGKPEGFWKTYYETGMLKSEGNRKNHLLDGNWRFYRDNGALEKEIEYVTGKKEGVTKIYSEEGLLIRKEILVNEQITGIVEEYYPEEQVIRTTYLYVDNRPDGPAYEYAKNGRLISIIDYEKGVLKTRKAINRMDTKGLQSGLWIEFFDNDDEYEKLKKLEGRYRKGLKNGYFREYDRSGSLLGTTKYVNGEVVENAEELSEVVVDRTFYPDASVHWEKTYVNGVPHGVWKEYNDTGAVINSQVYELGG